MNRSKIEWCDHTWNPITGCRHDCKYCYAKKMTARFSGDVRLNIMAKNDYSTIAAADGSKDLYVLEKPMLNETGNALIYPFGFEPTYHRYRMNILDNLKMGNNVFVGAMADVFGAWVPDEWISDIFSECEKRPQHNYMFLTKNPGRYITLLMEHKLPETKNMWYGMSVTNKRQALYAERVTQDLTDKAGAFLSIEPLLEDISEEIKYTIANFVDWIIIGAQTGRNKDKIIPDFEWIKELVSQSDTAGIPVFMKDSLIQIVGEKNMRRDFPKQLQHKTLSKKMQDKLYSSCAKCKEHLKKSDMVAILARSKRGEQPKQFGFICKKCFPDFCKSLGLDLPALAGLIEDADVSMTFDYDGDNEDE